LAGVTVVVAACSTSPPAPPQRNADEQRQLERALAGRTAGSEVRCLPYFGSTDVQVIDDWTILFRQGGTVYLQAPPGGCDGIGSHRSTMVSRIWGNGQVCSGDIQHLVDVSTGIGGGSCVFGPFVPYTKLKS
jgi:hypothetical protein